LSIRLRPVATALLLALATAIFYGLAIGRQPIGPEEARILSHAQQPVAGVPPLLINTGDRWLQPLGVYATTLAHVVMPGFFAGRWASVVIAAVNAGLIFLVGWRLFGGYLAAFAAAIVLILMPAHMTYGRQGIDAIYVVPFVLLWLYALLGFLRHDRASAIALAAAALGAGVYSTAAAPLTMAFLFLTMIAVLWSAGRRKLSTYGIALASFSAMLLPLAVWFALHPQTYLDTYGSWAIHPAHVRNPLDGVLAFINPNTLGTRASAYWGLIDPSFLFFSSAEGRAPLHWATAPLIVLGIYRCVSKRTTASMLVLTGTVVAPMAGAGFGQPHYVVNALALLPFLALLAGYGLDFIREKITGPPPPEPVEEYETYETHQSR
jgi:hypothetical protein